MQIKRQITAQDSGENLTRYFAEIRSYEALTREQEKDLITRYQKKADKKALDQLIKANLKFVISIAKNYQGQGTPILDLISEGNSGLLEAAKRFDTATNLKFFSYAVWWIRIKIFTCLDLHKRTIQLPANRELLVIRIKREIPLLENLLGRYPTAIELAEHLKIKYKNEGKTNPPGVLDIEEAICYGKRTKSIHEKVGNEDEDETLESLLPGDMETDEDRRGDSMITDLDRFFFQLCQTEYDVLILSTGLNGEHPFRNSDIASKLGMKEKDVVKLKAKAMKRLKGLKNIQTLKDYLI